MRKKVFIYTFLLIIFINHFALSTPPNWSVNPSNFELVANMTATLQLDYNAVEGAENMIGLFLDEQCQGVASPIFAMNNWLYFVTIYSNANNE